MADDGTQVTDPAQDQDFLKAGTADKIAYLSARDPEFAKAAPHEQAGYINHLLGNDQPTQFEQDRPGKGISLEGSGTAAWDTLKKMAPSDPTGGRSLLDPKAWFNPDEAKFDPMHGGIAEAIDEAKAGYGRPESTPAKIGEGITSGLGSMFGVSGKQEAAHAARGEGGAILGDTAVPAALTLAPEIAKIPAVGRVAGKVGDIASRAKDATGLALRTEKGGLRPTVATVGRAGGTLLGTAVGGEPGGIAGALGGRALMDAIVPKRPFDIPTKGPLGASLPDTGEFYANKAADLVKRGREQNVLDRAAANPRNAPFEAPTDKPLGASLPDTGEFYEHRGADLMKRGAQQSILDRAESAKKPGIVEAGAPVETGPEIEGEGRPATWTNERVMELARTGNRAAITQAGVRGLQLPPNARYVMGDLDYRNAITSPREVTKFTPEGQPIRQSIAGPTGEPAPYMDPYGFKSPFPAAIPENAAVGQVPAPVNAGITEPVRPTPEQVAPRSITEPIIPSEETGTGEIRGTNQRITSGKSPTGFERRIFQQMITSPEGEQLGQRIRETRAGQPSGISEAQALQRIMQDQDAYDAYKGADQKTRDAMLVKAKNEMAAKVK